MEPKVHGRNEGRILFFGIKKDEVIAFLAIPHSYLSQEIEAIDVNNINLTGIFKEILIDSSKGHDSKVLLLEELKRIHLLEWINSKRLNSDGYPQLYLAQNGGGYTLEAELGIKPNGDANPDYLGWEVKQFSVNNFVKIGNKAITLMTPEPNGGLYVAEGVERFVLNYGYTNNDGERYDFTGIHNCNAIHGRTGLKLILHGYDYESNSITKANGFIGLITADDNIAGSWSFTKLIEHWKRKHAKAVYIPSISRISGDMKQYYYGNIVRLFQNTDFFLFLRALYEGVIYYDPGIKLIKCDRGYVSKRRSQFRVKSNNLVNIYKEKEEVNLLKA
ncbi:MAG: MvaI/BcnI family restriction endonuclease [Clostridia bacterium]